MITLFGHGKTTKAIAKRFAGQCQIFDDNFVTKETDAFGNLLLPPSEFDPNTSYVEIPSPGFPAEHPLIQKVIFTRNVQCFLNQRMLCWKAWAWDLYIACIRVEF